MNARRRFLGILSLREYRFEEFFHHEVPPPKEDYLEFVILKGQLLKAIDQMIILTQVMFGR